jgi:hypothetical protein
MKSIDTELINQRNQQRESIIHKGKQAESMLSEGVTLEGLQKEAQEVLGIGSDDLIQLSYESKLAKENKQTQAFIFLARSIIEFEGSGLISDNELVVMKSVESKVAEVIAKRFDVDVADLYSEGE